MGSSLALVLDAVHKHRQEIQRRGEAGMEELLAQSIEAAKRASAIQPSSLKRVIVDTTVMEKAIA